MMAAPTLQENLVDCASVEAAGFDFQHWCDWLDYSPFDPEAIAEWNRLTDLYPRIWNALGTEAFLIGMKEATGATYE